MKLSERGMITQERKKKYGDGHRSVIVTEEVALLESAIEACRLYLKTGTPFARAALERALEELE